MVNTSPKRQRHQTRNILIRSSGQTQTKESKPVPVSGSHNVPTYEWEGSVSKKDRKKKKSTYFSPPLEIEYAKSIYVESPYERRWDQFRSLQFVGNEALISSDPDLLAHAKTYVFATRYLVDSLRGQCLKSLHRDLCKFSLNSRSVSHILDLLQYTFEQTGRQEPNGCLSLRELVIHYASCEARTLIENARFRHLLDEYGEMGSDLVAKLLE